MNNGVVAYLPTCVDFSSLVGFEHANDLWLNARICFSYNDGRVVSEYARVSILRSELMTLTKYIRVHTILFSMHFTNVRFERADYHVRKRPKTGSLTGRCRMRYTV